MKKRNIKECHVLINSNRHPNKELQLKFLKSNENENAAMTGPIMYANLFRIDFQKKMAIGN